MINKIRKIFKNHRRYVKSRDDSQLLGNVNPSVVQDCSPFDRSDDLPIVPCGAIANSMFNGDCLNFTVYNYFKFHIISIFCFSDTFYLRKLSFNANNFLTVNQTVEFNFKGIAWDSDIKSKFRNPADYPKNIGTI